MTISDHNVVKSLLELTPAFVLAACLWFGWLKAIYTTKEDAPRRHSQGSQQAIYA